MLQFGVKSGLIGVYHVSLSWSMESNAIHKKHWVFAEHPIFWGGVGVLVGAVGVAYSMKVIFVVAGAIFSVAIVRTQFFEGKKLYQRGLGNLALIALMGSALFIIWRITPKPKEPATVNEIAVAVIKKLHEDVPTSSTPPLAPKTAPSESLTPEPKGTPQKPRKHPQQKPVPGKPVPAPGPSTPPQTARLIVSQKPQTSTRADAPYKTEVTIQTTSDFPSLQLIVRCDKPLVDAAGGFTGMSMMMMTTQGIVKDQPNVYILTYQSATPSFGPQNPIVVSVWSKEAVKCEAATF